MTYSPPHMAKQQYQAYANAKMTVGKVRQVVMLYDGVIDALKKTMEAISQQDPEARFNSLAKASDIIDGLQASLDYDNGGEISKLLHDYYSSIDARIFSVHRTSDLKMCEQLIKEVKMMRDAWDEIDRNQVKDKEEGSDTAPKKRAETAPVAPPRSDAVLVESANVGFSA